MTDGRVRWEKGGKISPKPKEKPNAFFSLVGARSETLALRGSKGIRGTFFWHRLKKVFFSLLLVFFLPPSPQNLSRFAGRRKKVPRQSYRESKRAGPRRFLADEEEDTRKAKDNVVALINFVLLLFPPPFLGLCVTFSPPLAHM